MLHAQQLGAAVDVGRAIAVGAQRAFRAIGAATQCVGRGIDAHHAQLVGIVGFAVVAQAHVARPARRDVMVQRELRQMALALHLVHRLVQTAVGRHVQRRLRIRIQHGTAVERRVIVAKLIPEHGLRILAIPGHRRRDQQILALAEVAPVVLVDVIGHQAPGKARIGNRAGGVEGHATTRAAMGIGGGRQPQ